MAEIILITGGCRSGKSGFAMKKASEIRGKVIFLATAEPLDTEMAKRIAKHKKDRNKSWGLVEEPINIGKAAQTALKKARVVLLDCITLWVSNLLFMDKKFSEQQAERKARAFLQTVKKANGTVIVVTNEVGWGIVPHEPMTRLYRDCVGRVNQIIAETADEVYLCVSGIAQRIK